MVAMLCAAFVAVAAQAADKKPNIVVIFGMTSAPGMSVRIRTA